MSAFVKNVLCKLTETACKTTTVNQYRCYARFSHRQPRRVFTPEEYAQIKDYDLNIKEHIETKGSPLVEHNVIDLGSQNRSSKWKPNNLKLQPPIKPSQNEEKRTKKARYKIQPIKKTYDMLDTVIDAEGNLIYKKMESNDPTIGKLLTSVQKLTKQRKNDLIMLEGKRLIKDALKADCVLKTLIFSKKTDIEELQPYLPKTGAKLVKMPYNELKKYSDLTTSPGVIAVMKTPDVSDYAPKSSIPLTVICDNIREPGNLGAILRTAAAVGVERVILTKGCVHLWDPKVLRSASGCHFCLNIHQKTEWASITESLGIPNTAVVIADNKVVGEIDKPVTADELLNVNLGDTAKNLSSIISQMPSLPYHGFDFTKFQSIVLIIGGETEGISEESYLFADRHNGCRLNIPLGNEVDSLNTGTALGIIAFEIKRQLDIFKNMNIEMYIKQ